jgi:hypothetical protein
MVAHVELAPNDRRHALGGPHLTEEPKGLGAPGEQIGELCELLGSKPGRGAGWWLAVQGFHASLAHPSQPLAHRALADAQGLGDGLAHPAPLMECPCPQSARCAPVPRRAWLRSVHGAGVPQPRPGLLLHAGVSSRSLLFTEEEIQRPAGADGVEQGLEFRRWGPGGPGAPAAPEQVPRGQPAADLAHRHRPRHRAASPVVAARLIGAYFPPAPPRWARRGPGYPEPAPRPPGWARPPPTPRLGTKPTSKR